jgi:hypothetical protein
MPNNAALVSTRLTDVVKGFCLVNIQDNLIPAESGTPAPQTYTQYLGECEYNPTLGIKRTKSISVLQGQSTASYTKLKTETKKKWRDPK